MIHSTYRTVLLVCFILLFISCGLSISDIGDGSSEPTTTVGGSVLEDCDDGTDDDSVYCENLSTYTLTASAYKNDDDEIIVILNPVMNQRTGVVVSSVSVDDITITSDGTTLTPSDISQIDELNTINADIVFILDTTGSMAWAINSVKDSLIAFSDLLNEYGIEPLIGGVEYGDEVRTYLDLTDASTFKTWVETLSATGGDDAAENPLDAYLYAFNNFSFTNSSQQYFILITDQGFHIAGDGTSYTENNLQTLINAMQGNVFHGIIHAQIEGTTVSGEHPQQITDTMGGIYLNLLFDLSSYLTSFELDLNSSVIGINIQYTNVVTIPSTETAGIGSGDTLELSMTIDGTTYTTDLILP